MWGFITLFLGLYILGPGHFSIQLDVAKEESVQQVFKHIVEKYNAPPTIVVNCAGILRYMGTFFDETPDAMQHLFDVNFKVIIDYASFYRFGLYNIVCI